MSRIPRILVGISLALLLGWNSAFLQGVAWCSMVVSYGQQVPLRTAVSWTFDGKHACRLCHLAQKTASDEHQPQTVQLSLKIDAVVPGNSELAVPAVPSPTAVFARSSFPPSRSLRPVLLPPRLA